MKFFKNKENKIYAYDDKQVNNGYGSNLTSITETEKDEILSPKGSDLINLNVSNAKSIRDSAISSDLESGGFLWQVRNAVDLQNIQDGIDEALYNPSKAGEVISFRMADNTWKEITVSDLEKVKSDYRARKLAVYSQFKTWTETDMKKEFKVDV